MKNPFDRLVQSKLNFWKKADPHQEITERAGSKPLPLPRHPTFPTKIVDDFINSLAKKPDPVVLDIGPVIGSNIEYFLSFGIKVYMEDLLAAYAKPKYSTLIDDKVTLDENKFFAENFSYGNHYFDGLICWDILDYLDAKFAKKFVARISAKMKPGSLVVGFFHTQKGQGPAALHKYRLINESTLEYIPLETRMEPKKIYPSREINQLFPGYQSQKFYLLKNGLLEVMLRKT